MSGRVWFLGDPSVTVNRVMVIDGNGDGSGVDEWWYNGSMTAEIKMGPRGDPMRRTRW